MSKRYKNLKRIFEKIQASGDDSPYIPIISYFIKLEIYEDAYLLKKVIEDEYGIRFKLRQNGIDMFIDCYNFGIIVEPDGTTSIHT